MAVRVFSLRCRQLLRKYESSKVSMEVRCLSSLLGTTENVRSTEVPQKTAVRHHRPAARAGSLLAYYSGDNHALKPRPRGSSRRRSLYTSLAVSNGGATVDSTHKAFYSTTYGTTSGSGSGGSEDDGGVEGSTKGEEGISSGVPEESNLQAYAQEVSGCEECHPDTAARDQELEGLLRNIEIAKTAQTLQDSIPVKRKPSRVGTRRSSPMTIEELVAFLHEERAVGVCVIRLPSEMDYVNYFVTCSGMGARHIRRIADNLAAELKAVKFGGRAAVEGRESEGWIAVDMGTVVVHLMSEEVREKYELEKLWTLGRNYDDQYREMETLLELSDIS